MKYPFRAGTGWRLWLLLSVSIFAVIGAASFFGYRLWFTSIHFVSTDNAQVAAALVQVGSINAGRIASMNVDVGVPVGEGQVVAVVDIPAVIFGSEVTGTSKMGFRDVQDQLAPVVAPVSGVVAARWARMGDTVQAGQAIVTLLDTRQVWVSAYVDERKIGRVRPGQYVDVQVDSLGGTMAGWVEAVSPVTAATFSLLPPRNTAGSYNKVAQLVPVKISLEDDHLPLIPGSSVRVRIHVGSPGGG